MTVGCTTPDRPYNLGVLLDSLKDQVAIVARRAFVQLCIRHSCTLTWIVKSVCLFYMGLHLKSIQKLELGQNAVVHTVLGVWGGTYNISVASCIGDQFASRFNC